MAFGSHESLRKPPQPLSEAVGTAPFGTMIGWRAPGGMVYGVVVGKSGNELLALTTYDKTMRKDPSLRFYRDENLSGKLPMLTQTVAMDLQRVPASKAFKHGRIRGAALQPYTMAAATLQLEGEENMSSLTEKTMWIQGAVKKPGRLPKLLGLTQDKYDALSKEEKVAKIDQALADLEGDSGKAAKSKRSALILGKRFIGGIKKKAKKEAVDFSAMTAKLAEVLQSLDEAGVRKVNKKGLADELATDMISAFTKTLQKWVVYRKFRPDLAALIYKHLDPPPQGIEWSESVDPRRSLSGDPLMEDAAESAFKQELRGWAVNEFEGFMKDLDKKMLAIKKGKWPTHGMEYAVTRYRPGSMTHEDFIDEVMDHYLAWRSNMKHAAKSE